MHEFHGGCHCGNIRVVYRTVVAPEHAKPRACQCTFCRKQNTRAVSDPQGALAIKVRDDDEMSRYRFGLSTADYLICRICGIYVGAFMPDPDDSRGLATLMAGVLDVETRYPAPEPIVYDGETEDDKRDRRRVRWTPAQLVIGA